MNHVHQVAPVIYYYVRPSLDHAPDAVFVFLRSGSVNSKDVEAFVHQSGSHVILRGKRIASGDEHFGSAAGEHFAKVSRLGFKMDGKGDLEPFEWLIFGKFFLNLSQQGHVIPDPADFQLPAFPVLRIANFAKRRFHLNINFAHLI